MQLRFQLFHHHLSIFYLLAGSPFNLVSNNSVVNCSCFDTVHEKPHKDKGNSIESSTVLLLNFLLSLLQQLFLLYFSHHNLPQMSLYFSLNGPHKSILKVSKNGHTLLQTNVPALKKSEVHNSNISGSISDYSVPLFHLNNLSCDNAIKTFEVRKVMFLLDRISAWVLIIRPP